MKTCKCGRGPVTSSKNYRCKDCNRERMAAAYAANPGKMREISYSYRKRNPEKYKEQNARYRMKLKIEVLSYYDELRCHCCGETEVKFLTLDHMDNDGADDRKITGGGHAAYRWLKSNGFPPRNFKASCQNCNAARYYYGVCPHKQMVIADDPIKYLGENI